MNARIPIVALAILALTASLAIAAEKPRSGAAAPPAAAPAKAGAGPSFAAPGLPDWQMPAQYRVDLVMTHEGQSFTMTRFVDGARMRTEMNMEGRQMIMLERPEDEGAVYNIMPSEKMIMKMKPGALAPEAAAEEKPAAPADVKIERLGAEKLDGRPAVKYRMTSEGHTALGWFEEGTGAPLRMEAEGAVIEWKNFKPGPIPARQFELPKDYQVIDMEEQMKQMQKLGGGGMMGGAARGAMAGLGGGMGAGAGAGAGGMLSGAAGNYGSQMGSGMGQQFGAGIGASFGGPLGAMAGGYIGGKVGGWLGRKTADAVTPGPPSR